MGSMLDAKSFCTCGHLGDGPHSYHAGFSGHGRCNSVGCKCGQFTWKKFTAAFTHFLLTQRIEARDNKAVI